MSDTYGSGLTFDRAGGGEGAPGLPQGADAAAPLDLSPQGPVTQAPDAPAPGPAPQQPPQDGGPSFGSSLRNMLPGTHYTAPDPQMAPLDQAADLLQQRVKRASSIATNPLAQLFAPEQAAAAREFVPKAAEQLQKIETQKSAIQAGRVQARTLGLDPSEVSDQATMDDRVTIAQSKALKGDMRSFQGLQAVAPEKAAAIAPQVYEVVAGHLDKAQLAFDSLSSMENEGQYRAKVNQLRQDGTLTNLEALGLKLPPTFEAFNAVKAAEGRALREARIGINTIGQKLEERNTYQPMEKKEAETYNGRLTTVYGDQVTNGQWGRNGASGTRGLVVNGAADPNNLGKKFTLATPEQRKAIKEEFDGAMPKDEVEKYRAFNRTYKLATEDAKGNAVPEGKINTNPNVQQGISEGLASMLRGGSGGANTGLLKIELDKRGWSQQAIDGLVTNYAGTINTLFKDADKPYLSAQTQKQIRDVMDVLKTYNDSSVGTRVVDIAKRAGALGLNGSAFGLGKDEVAGVVTDALEAGRREQVERMKPNHQAIGGGDGVIQLSAQRPGATPAALPPGSQPANQLPGAAPILTPVQQAGQPPNGGAPQPGQPPAAPPANSGQPTNGGTQPAPPTLSPQPGGAGQPVTIAGQQVTLPPGITPAYVQANQRIESGNEKDPWKSGTKLSSASGAFQFINSTWAADKPPGAPARAADATPQQQVEALANRAAKDTGTLKANNLPVTDTNLYVLHNVGPGAGTSLLQANPGADARTIVGEAAARNNPLFFKGRPTVATVLQRYAEAMNAPPDEGGPKPKPGAGGATAMAPGNPTDDPAGMAWNNLTPAQQAAARAAVKEGATDALPAIGSTVGAVGGMLSPVPGGAIMGGAAGGGAGQSLKDYLKGNPQSPLEIAKQTALGGVLGVAPAGRPILGTAARVVGAGGVDAAAEAAKGSDGAEVVDAGLKGGAEAIGGEAFGRALGMVGHKVYSMFAPDARKAVQTAAKNYAEAAKTLETEQPKITSATGSVTNPEYMAAEVAKTKAERVLKDAGLNPEEAAYAHRVSADAVPKQEAQAAKPGALEQASVGEGYRQIEKEVGEKGVGAVKAAPKLPDGPVAAVEGKQVSAKHRELAERTEMAITAPAKNWQEKWTQLKEARSDLLQAERDALGSTATGKTQTAKDMRVLADTVRAQQEKAAKYVFGAKEGEAVMQRLKTLDVRYRRLMEATNGGDLSQAARLKGEAGREADKRFRAFAHDDPAALAAWAAMRKHGPNVEQGVHDLVAAERIPVLGKVFSGIKLLGSFNQWMQQRAAGSPVKFSEVLGATPSTSARTTRNILGTAAQRGAVQGDVLGGAAQ